MLSVVAKLSLLSNMFISECVSIDDSVVIQKKIASTGSVYLRLDFNSELQIRISNHKTIETFAYDFIVSSHKLLTAFKEVKSDIHMLAVSVMDCRKRLKSHSDYETKMQKMMESEKILNLANIKHGHIVSNEKYAGFCNEGNKKSEYEISFSEREMYCVNSDVLSISLELISFIRDNFEGTVIHECFLDDKHTIILFINYSLRYTIRISDKAWKSKQRGFSKPFKYQVQLNLSQTQRTAKTVIHCLMDLSEISKSVYSDLSSSDVVGDKGTWFNNNRNYRFHYVVYGGDSSD